MQPIKTFKDSHRYARILVFSLYDSGYPNLWAAASQRAEVKKVFVVRRREEVSPAISKLTYVKDSARALLYRRRLMTAFTESDTIVLVGHILMPFLLCNMFKLRNMERYNIYAVGVFFHNLRLMNIYGRLLRTVLPSAIKFVAFSKADIPLYKQYFKLPDSQIFYVPYGTGPIRDIQVTEGNYYFAGGYSNRNYDIVIDAFKKLEEQLVICCSRRNNLPSALPSNIIAYNDLPRREFSKLVAESKICIMPLYSRSGASGQSVTLQYMQFGKPIIATRVPTTIDYLNDQNAILIDPNSSKELGKAVKLLSTNEDLRKMIAKNAQASYYTNFQGKHFEDKFLSTILGDRISKASGMMSQV